jgi:hypothetical protein
MKNKLIIYCVLCLFVVPFSVQAESYLDRRERDFKMLANFAESEFPDLFPENQPTKTLSLPDYTPTITLPYQWRYRLYSNNNAIGMYLLQDIYIALPMPDIKEIGTIGNLVKTHILENDPPDCQ